MKTNASFGETDTGFLTSDFNITVKTMQGAAVDTTGWSMTHSQRGTYEIDVPLCTSSGTIYLGHKTDPNVFYDGFIDDLWAVNVPGSYTNPQAGYVVGALSSIVTQFTEAIGRLTALTYSTGQLSNIYSLSPGANIQLHTKTNYSASSTVGEKWADLLSRNGSKVFFTARSATTGLTPLSVECTITDAIAGVISIVLTKANTDIKAGDYFWQLEVRTYNVNVNPPALEEVWMMQEGKMYVKSSFKLW